MSLLARLTGRLRPRPCGAREVRPDLPWRDGEYCVIDIETTGLDLRRDEIVSCGAVLVRDGRVLAGSSIYSLVRPTCPVSVASLSVHALRRVDLATAPPLGECADALAGVLSERILVAHAAWIEEAFLRRALRSRGMRLTGPVVDTAALARGLGLASKSGHREPSLEWLAQRLALPVHTPHHALGDALTTAELLLVLAARMSRDAHTPTIGQLVDLSDQHRLR